MKKVVFKNSRRNRNIVRYKLKCIKFEIIKINWLKIKNSELDGNFENWTLNFFPSKNYAAWYGLIWISSLKPLFSFLNASLNWALFKQIESHKELIKRAQFSLYITKLNIDMLFI